MDKLQLEQKWKALKPDGPGYKSLRIDGNCIPDLFIGIYNVTTRCLILKLPNHQQVDFQSTEKANLSIEFFRETKWIILKLLDNDFIDLFDDLIISIYGRIYDMADAGIYSSELISTFYKWSEFFNDKTTFRLSEETIRGIFSELIVLKDFIVETDAMVLNDMLGYWKGPYNHHHDFILPQKDLEVKTMEDTALDISVSSEYQLSAESGKGLELIVVRILRDSSGISLRDLLIDIRRLVVGKLADFTIILRGLSAYGLNLRGLEDYDGYRYKPIAIDTYDCIAYEFPKIVHANIPAAINQVSYQIRTTALNKYLLSSKKL